jgi:hypothetical protein
MEQPINTKIYEGELASFWIDKDNILCALSKNTSRTLKKQKDNFTFIRQIIGDKKVCMLSDSTNANPPDIETRDYMEREMPTLFKAMAILSKSAIGEIFPKAFLVLNSYPMPMKYFSEEKEARDWLKQYL